MPSGELADLTMSTIVGSNESRLQPVNETALNETASFTVPAPAPPADRESPPQGDGQRAGLLGRHTHMVETVLL